MAGKRVAVGMPLKQESTEYSQRAKSILLPVFLRAKNDFSIFNLFKSKEDGHFYLGPFRERVGKTVSTRDR